MEKRTGLGLAIYRCQWRRPFGTPAAGDWTSWQARKHFQRATISSRWPTKSPGLVVNSFQATHCRIRDIYKGDRSKTARELQRSHAGARIIVWPENRLTNHGNRTRHPHLVGR
jgi:hypothetical protein